MALSRQGFRETVPLIETPCLFDNFEEMPLPVQEAWQTAFHRTSTLDGMQKWSHFLLPPLVLYIALRYFFLMHWISDIRPDTGCDLPDMRPDTEY
jgi:hypothetical protein